MQLTILKTGNGPGYKAHPCNQDTKIFHIMYIKSTYKIHDSIDINT